MLNNSLRSFGGALIGLFALTSVFVLPAHAYKVSPLVMTLEPVGDGSKEDVLITNTHDYPLTLEVTATERSVAADGKETEVDASDDWIIFPPMAIVQPGEQQRVRVQYAGGVIDESKAYRIIVSQVAVNDGSGNLKVGFNYKFKAAAYVTPKDAKFDIQTQSIKPANGGYTVELLNTGNRHAVLSTGTWLAQDAMGKSSEIAMAMTKLKDDPLIAPGGKRIVFVPFELLGGLTGLSSLTVTPER